MSLSYNASDDVLSWKAVQRSLGLDDDAPQGFPPGHFYSPIPTISAVFSREEKIFALPCELPGINLNVEGQLKTVRAIAPFGAQQPYKLDGDSGTRFSMPNDFFGAGDAIVYFGMIHWLRPNRVVEIGSGYSTMVLLDSLFKAGLNETSCTCIEPFPDTLQKLIWASDAGRIHLLRQELQDVDSSVFEALEANDILFIDSTHVAKTGSDVNSLLFDILPKLKAGVYIHFHDIFYPFEYPRKWILQGRAWNEAYALRAFLQYNDAFEICLWNSYLGTFHPEEFRPQMPLFVLEPGSSLWLRRRR